VRREGGCEGREGGKEKYKITPPSIPAYPTVEEMSLSQETAPVSHRTMH